MIKRVVFVFNPKSGSSFRITKDLQKLKKIFAEKHSQIIYQECSLLSNDLSKLVLLHEKENCLFVACGGDGTVASVAEKIYKNPLFSVSVLPYGTGNDFSRALGIYSVASDLVAMADIFAGKKLTVSEFDMWAVDGRLFLNYFSMGFDAAVVVKFQKIRNHLPPAFRRPLMNRVLYLISGVFHLFYSIPAGAMLKYGEKEIDISGSKSLVLGNINSYAGGKQLNREVTSNDQLLNIFKIKGIKGFVQLVLGKGIKGQSEKSGSFILNLNSDVLCQIDGEPFPILKGRHSIDFLGKLQVIGV